MASLLTSSRSWETRWPLLAAACATAVAAVMVSVVWRPSPLPASVPAGGMTFGIVVAGFVATQRNMLLPISSSAVMRWVARTGYHEPIIAYLTHCVRAGLLVTVISLVGLFLGDCILLWQIWISSFSGAAVLVLSLMCRNEGIMTLVMRRYFREQHAGQDLRNTSEEGRQE